MAAVLSLLGTTGFIAWMLPAASGVPLLLGRRLLRLWRLSGVTALVAGTAWFTLQSVAIAGASDASEVWAALPLVAEHTRFGTTLLARLALVLMATLSGMAAPRPAVSGTGSGFRRHCVAFAIVLTAVALDLQGAIGHAGATAGAIGNGLVLSEWLHLLAAGLWLGGLLPLWFALHALPSKDAALLCERYSPLGLGCVLVIAGTGFAQALSLIGSVPALLGTPYGHIALLKITLFVLALLLAAINRLALTDRLAAGRAGARRRLLVSVSVETIIGLMVIAAAALLASNVPGAHQTPNWSFSWQLSLAALADNPILRRSVLISDATSWQQPMLEMPIPAPALAITCDNVDASKSSDLRHQAVHVIAGDAVAQPRAHVQMGAIILLPPAAEADEKPKSCACIAAKPVTWAACAVLADLPPDKFAGTEFLIDPNGWLRAVQHTGSASAWSTPDDLGAAIRAMSTDPVETPARGTHEHHH